MGIRVGVTQVNMIVSKEGKIDFRVLPSEDSVLFLEH